jgi:predicted nucleic-acid-binding Zn-ribbon protein
MQCKACGSHNQTVFNAEINVHFPGLKNVDRPAVFVFPTLLLCLNCGFTEFTLSESELRLLDETQVSEMQGL